MFSFQTISQTVFPWYLIFLIGFLTTYALFELIMPERCISLWHGFIQTKILPLYGIVLMIGGFPLTQYYQTLPGKALFAVGIVVVFTGPFILLFPEHFRKVFDRVTDESTPAELRKIAWSDAVMRLLAAALIAAVRFL